MVYSGYIRQGPARLGRSPSHQDGMSPIAVDRREAVSSSHHRPRRPERGLQRAVPSGTPRLPFPCWSRGAPADDGLSRNFTRGGAVRSSASGAVAPPHHTRERRGSARPGHETFVLQGAGMTLVKRASRASTSVKLAGRLAREAAQPHRVARVHVDLPLAVENAKRISWAIGRH